MSSISARFKPYFRWCCEVLVPEVTSPEATLTGNDVTESHVTGSDHMCMRNQFPHFFLTIVVVQNVPLRMTGSSLATGCDVTESYVTPKGLVGCTYAQPEVLQYPLYLGPFERK